MEEVLKANKEKALAEKRERERLRAMRDQEAREKLAAGSVAPIAPGSGNFASALASAGLGGAGGGGSSFGMFDGADLVAALGSGGVTGSKGPPEPPKDRSTLATMRVIRRNLVYAVGLPPTVAAEETLRRPEYFGQYGKISKIVINRNHNPGDTRRASASAYVTFAHKEDTLACVLALDGFYHDGRNVRASYGTSKYCSAFIKTVRCNNPDCTYLHHMGDTEDTFTKQEIQAGYVTSGRDVMARQQQIMAQQAALLGGTGKKKVGGGGPSSTGKNATNPVFPPPTYDEPLPKKPVSQRGQPAIIMNRAQSVGPSAASIVAGGGKSSTAPPAAHTLLTPLKRGTSMPPAKPVGVTSPSADLTPAELLALEKEKKEAMAQQQRELAQKAKAAATVPPSSPSHSSIGSGASRGEISTISSKTTNTVIIGGSSGGEIGPGGLGGSNLMGSPLLGGGFTNGSSLGGMGSIAPPPSAMDFGSATGSGVLGGQPLNAGLIGGTSLGAPPGNSFQLDSLLGSTSNNSGGDKWGAIGGGSSQNNTIGGSAALSSGGLWEGEDKRFNPAPIGPRNGGLSNGQNSDVGGVSLFGTNHNGFSNGGSGSSALASMLGIELPTGSGSLREASGSSSLFGPSGQAPIGGLDTAPNSNRPSVIGSNPRGGMQPIGAPGGGRAVNNGFSGGVGAIGGGNNNDVALLQSLLPGVNITSGNTYRQSAQQQPVGVGGLNQTSDLWIGGNNNNNNNAGASQEQQQRGNGIW